jgi:uncharacterized protein with FMN-binding domain
MKRAVIVGTGTVVGVAAVLALNPDGSSAAGTLPRIAAAPAAAAGGATSAGSGTAPSGGAAGSSATSSSKSQTATGTSVDVGYGTVQVQVTLSGGKITDIQPLQLPQNDGHSARISSEAWPMLVQQAISAQSSQISGISGASYTSYGFAQSLKAALLSVGHAA